LIYALARRGRAVLPAMVPFWKIGLAGGTLAVISYTIATWAMSVAPIAIVAALRETSVLFGALIAVLFLGEPLRTARIAAAGMIVCGLMLLRVA
jgi:drug/metabolite transporter (DMT)-like permease